MKAYAAGRFAFDTETTSIDPMVAELVGFSMAVAPGEACYVPLGHRASSGSFDFGTHDGIVQIPVGEALALLKPLLEEPSILKIGQNIKYDLNVLAQHGIKAAPLDDTMLMSYALDAGKGGHGMDDLAMRHLGHACISFDQVIAHVPGKKSERTFGQVPLDKATEYAAEDADVTLRLWMVLKPRLAAERLMTVYETLERPLIGVIAEMERCGILVDGAILSRLSSTFAQGVARLEEEVNRLVGHKFNLGSPRQLGELLFDRLQLPGGKRTKNGQWETRAGLLDDLAANEELPDDARRLINTMLEWRQLTKLRSTYTDALPEYVHGGTGRIHTCYSLGATTTGRLASSEPNLQNIPIRTKEGREIRTAFVAAPGKKLISADYSQIELRVLAHMADIPQLRKAFDEGLDIHAMTASEMFGVPVEGMPPEVRRRAKAINFGIIYGISAFGLANQLGIPKDEAGAYIKTYFERFPGIRAYMDDTKRRGARARLRPDGVRTAHPLSGDQHQEPRCARQSRAGGDQRADPGLGGRHHSPCHGAHAGRSRSRRPQVGAHASASPRRAGVRGRRGRCPQGFEHGEESDGERGASRHRAGGADPCRRQGRRQLGSRALARRNNVTLLGALIPRARKCDWPLCGQMPTYWP